MESDTRRELRNGGNEAPAGGGTHTHRASNHGQSKTMRNTAKTHPVTSVYKNQLRFRPFSRCLYFTSKDTSFQKMTYQSRNRLYVLLKVKINNRGYMFIVNHDSVLMHCGYPIRKWPTPQARCSKPRTDWAFALQSRQSGQVPGQHHHLIAPWTGGLHLSQCLWISAYSPTPNDRPGGGHS